MIDTIVVVPCYNESHRFDSAAYTRFIGRHANVGFVFVNDGSIDQTPTLLGALEQAHPDNVQVQHLPANVGKSEAIRRGVLCAIGDQPRYVGYWDADLATPLDMIPAFAAFLADHPDLDVVMGSRVQMLGRNIERRLLRHYLGRIFATIVSAMLSLRVYDTQCGAKLFRVSPRLSALFRDAFSSRWLIDVELLARLTLARHAEGTSAVRSAVYEFPLLEWKDVGRSKLRIRDIVSTPWHLASIFVRYKDAGALNRRSVRRQDQHTPRTPPA